MALGSRAVTLSLFPMYLALGACMGIARVMGAVADRVRG